VAKLVYTGSFLARNLFITVSGFGARPGGLFTFLLAVIITHFLEVFASEFSKIFM